MTQITKLVLTFLVLLSFQLILAACLPVTQDEAYYFYWARYLDFGYFDHPPMIAWFASLTNLFPASVFWARLPGVLASALSFPIIYNILRMINLKDNQSILAGLLLSQFNLAGLAVGLIQTPDLPMQLFWALALHEAVAAIRFDEKRWITAGIATGLGIQGKYTMFIMGLVFLYTLIRSHRLLLRPWPYLGGLACFITLAPHLTWNAQHEWISFRFQLGRGFLDEYNIATQRPTDLIAPGIATPDSKVFQLAQYFADQKREEKPKPKPSPFAQSWRRVQNYIGGQLAVWGGFLLVGIGFVIRRRFFQRSSPEKNSQSLDPEVRHLLQAATWVPLILFGLVSPFQNIEANWPAMYTIAASILIVWFWRLSLRWLLVGAFINCLLITAITVHALSPLPTKKPYRDRILRETTGYKDLAAFVTTFEVPVFADNYQNLSMLAFYAPQLRIAQWPGIARISEAVRRAEMSPFQMSDLRSAGGFLLVTSNFLPPEFEGFEASRLWAAIDCPKKPLLILQALHDDSQVDCQAIHRWSIIQYRWKSD